MRIADSTVNMLSGRNYTQTGMRTGGSYGSSFMGIISSFDMKKSGSMTRDTYQTDKNNNGRRAKQTLCLLREDGSHPIPGLEGST